MGKAGPERAGTGGHESVPLPCVQGNRSSPCKRAPAAREMDHGRGHEAQRGLEASAQSLSVLVYGPRARPSLFFREPWTLFANSSFRLPMSRGRHQPGAALTQGMGWSGRLLPPAKEQRISPPKCRLETVSKVPVPARGSPKAARGLNTRWAAVLERDGLGGLCLGNLYTCPYFHPQGRAQRAKFPLPVSYSPRGFHFCNFNNTHVVLLLLIREGSCPRQTHALRNAES